MRVHFAMSTKKKQSFAEMIADVLISTLFDEDPTSQPEPEVAKQSGPEVPQNDLAAWRDVRREVMSTIGNSPSVWSKFFTGRVTAATPDLASMCTTTTTSGNPQVVNAEATSAQAAEEARAREAMKVRAKLAFRETDQGSLSGGTLCTPGLEIKVGSIDYWKARAERSEERLEAVTDGGDSRVSVLQEEIERLTSETERLEALVKAAIPPSGWFTLLDAADKRIHETMCERDQIREQHHALRGELDHALEQNRALTAQVVEYKGKVDQDRNSPHENDQVEREVWTAAAILRHRVDDLARAIGAASDELDDLLETLTDRA